jgi:hypothetical protein
MRRAAVVLVLLAALCGAPSSALGDAAPAATDPALPAQVGGDAEGPDSDQLLLLLGIVVGGAAVTLVGTGWLLTARTRDDDPDAAAAAAADARRARQRARAAGHDPVLAAMGLDEEPPPSDGADR